MYSSAHSARHKRKWHAHAQITGKPNHGRLHKTRPNTAQDRTASSAYGTRRQTKKTAKPGYSVTSGKYGKKPHRKHMCMKTQHTEIKCNKIQPDCMVSIRKMYIRKICGKKWNIQ